MELERPITRKLNLQDKFKKIDEKLERDLRILKWKQNNISRNNEKLFKKTYKTTMSKQSSYLSNCPQINIMENIDFSMVHYNGSLETNFEIKKHQVPSNNKEKNFSLSDKIKTLQKNLKNNIGGKFGNQCLKQIERICYAQTHNRSSYNKSKKLREDLKNIGQELKEQLSKKKKNVQKVEITNSILKENRIVYNIEKQDTDLVKDVKMFQTLLRGRAYQTMIMMAKIRFKPFLPSVEPAVTKMSVHSVLSDIGNNVFQDNILEFSTQRYVSRFFDTLSKETIRLDEESKNAMTVELGEVTRNKREAYEGNRRQLELRSRKEQDEILKQVMKIHQDLSELFAEEFMDEAIEQCAKEEGLKLIREMTSKNTNNKFYNLKCKNIENELVFNTIIPEAYKIIHKEETNCYNI